MARIEPFKGLRPRKDLVNKVASPPYDVLSSSEARNLAAGNDFSFLHVIKPEIDLPEGTDVHSDVVYDTAQKNFQRLQQEKILIQDETRNFYVYKQIWGDHVQVGLVAGASCQDYQNDIIKKHEYTRPDKEKDRMRHIESLSANTGPVFLTFKHNVETNDLFEKAMNQTPEYDFESDGVRHILYVVQDPALVEEIRSAFERVDFLYVADGHHRSASGTNVKIKRQENNPNHSGDEEYNFFLSVIFPDNQMKILPYNRVAKDIQGMCKAEFFHLIDKSFTWEETDDKIPTQSLEYCIYIDGKWYKIRAREDSYDPADPVNSLDASILQNNILAPILGIEDPRKDTRIHFVGGIRGTRELEKLVDSGEYKVAFSLYPTSIEQLFRVADSGNVMPPKSTWFEPKLKSGVIIHLLDE